VQSVALLGTGTMGAGMAAQLLGAGYEVAVWNRTRARAEPLRNRGARIADSPRDAAAGADIIIAMVADDNASRSAWLDADGALSGARPGTVLIESSTVTPAWIRELGLAAAGRNCTLLDAPVTGSRTQAETGQLLFLVGGDAVVLDTVRAVLSAMSRGIVHIGPQGAGAAIKLINNFVCGVQAAALAEAIALIERLGLERDRALTVLTEGAPGSPLVKGVSQRMTSQDYTINFRLDLMAKDLTYAIAEAHTGGIELVTAAAALEVFQRASASGHGAQDMAAVIEPLRA
jgi:3-hydroxyisobutyrate dehydrogenase